MALLVEPVAAPQSSRISATIAMLFPDGAVAAEHRGPANIADLHGEERQSCAGFSAKRTADFAAGRICARRALREFGYTDFALHVGADRRPRWPSGIVGSISHTGDFCGVVVARNVHFASLGFDAEIVGGVGEELWPALFGPCEIAFLNALPVPDRASAATVLFGAKEAYYKCHFGLSPTWLDFTDVVCTLENFNETAGSFVIAPAASYRGNVAVARSGRYALEGDVALTGVACRQA